MTEKQGFMTALYERLSRDDAGCIDGVISVKGMI